MKKFLACVAGLALAACTAQQKTRVNDTLVTICTSAPLAQALYNNAVANGENSKVNSILNYLQANCPAMLFLVQTIPVKESAPIPPPPPALPSIGPERG